MTFKTTACVTIHCDECGVVLDYDDHIPHFETEAKALEAAETYDWFVKGGIHRCDDHAPVCSCDDCDHTPPCDYEACPGCERHAHNAISPTLTPLPLAEPADGTQAAPSSEQDGAAA